MANAASLPFVKLGARGQNLLVLQTQVEVLWPQHSGERLVAQIAVPAVVKRLEESAQDLREPRLGGSLYAVVVTDSSNASCLEILEQRSNCCLAIRLGASPAERRLATRGPLPLLRSRQCPGLAIESVCVLDELVKQGVAQPVGSCSWRCGALLRNSISRPGRGASRATRQAVLSTRFSGSHERLSSLHSGSPQGVPPGPQRL